MATSFHKKVTLSIDYGRIYLIREGILNKYGYVPDRDLVPGIDLENGLYELTIKCSCPRKGDLQVTGKIKVDGPLVLGDACLIILEPDQFDRDAVDMLSPSRKLGRYIEVGRGGEYDVEVALERLTEDAEK